VLSDHVSGKIVHERAKLDSLRVAAGGGPTSSQRREIDAQETFVGELKAFQEEVERIAPLWNPDLNDGVILNYAPLWRMVKLRSWQKECKDCWDKLVAGDYDWAHLAMHLWPARVVPKCADDRSLAIAHGLEDLFWVEDIDGWRKLKKPDDEVKLQKIRRQSKGRDRLRELMAELAKEAAGQQPAAEVWLNLSSGDWDDKQAAWLLWPERVAAKCWADPIFANRIGLKVPAKQTKGAEQAFTDKLVSEGCLELVSEVESVLAGCQDPFARLWKALTEGARDELAIALSLWPDRVVDKCAEDVDLAERHHLRPFFWSRRTESDPWRPREAPKTEIANESDCRHNPEVQAALKALIEAPVAGGSPGRRGRRRRDQR
jgi:hypothetical protein